MLDWHCSKSQQIQNILDGVEPELAHLKIEMYQWQQLESVIFSKKYLQDNCDLDEVNPKSANALVFTNILMQCMDCFEPNKPFDRHEYISDKYFMMKLNVQLQEAADISKENSLETQTKIGGFMLDEIKKDLLRARKNKDKITKSVLTALVSEAQAIGKKALREPTQDEIITLIIKFKKNLGICITEAGTTTPAFERELDIYNGYLPKPFSEIDLMFQLGMFLGANPNANLGKVMQHFSKTFKARFDSKQLKDILVELGV